MADTTICAFFFMMTTFLRASLAMTYQVGDASGWTNKGVDYKSWASKQKIVVGDSIVFDYSPDIHNVVQVSKEDYQACSSAAQLGVYNSGNDVIRFDNPGKYYFICGSPRMCEQGQKLEIKVSSSSNEDLPDTPDSYPGGCTPPGGSIYFYSASSALSVYNNLCPLIFASSVFSLYLQY